MRKQICSTYHRRATSRLYLEAAEQRTSSEVRDAPEADVDLRADTEHSRAILQRPLSGWKPTRTVPPVVDGLTRKRGPSKCLSRRNSPGSRIASTFSASGQSDTPTLLDGSLRTITRGWRSRAPPILAGHGFCARGGCCRATC